MLQVSTPLLQQTYDRERAQSIRNEMKKLPNDNTAKQEIKAAFIICGQPIISVFQQHIAYSSGQTMLQEHSLQTAFINYRF